MGKAIFTNKTFLYGLVFFIIIVLLYNLYALLFEFEAFLFIPIIIQVTLLFLVFVRHQYIKVLLQIWSAVFLILGFGLFVLGGLLKDLANGFEYFDILNYFPKVVLLLAGLIIFQGSSKTIHTRNLDD
ncbi:hypothetical protein [Epilithonimonas lactis]|uniref:Uncharacterized protein n=1 Tax=Epilithonimonas lactis TaxID=421072 RepID=A0A085BHT9_9FLAO|nr:hypothetical protein [Epilithonimonas lactis]KFC22034.1 hypothetical protein IO89_08700 [Epilithonimonas lactis]SEQ52380.1 hypothetical protein SAMN04488097_2354 [Epilithonimonas lactis]